MPKSHNEKRCSQFYIFFNRYFFFKSYMILFVINWLTTRHHFFDVLWKYPLINVGFGRLVLHRFSISFSISFNSSRSFFALSNIVCLFALCQNFSYEVIYTVRHTSNAVSVCIHRIRKKSEMMNCSRSVHSINFIHIRHMDMCNTLCFHSGKWHII